MSTNPYEPPNALSQEHKQRVALRLDLRFWLWAVALVAILSPMGAVLGFAAFVAMAFALAGTGLAYRVSLPPVTIFVVAGVLISQAVALTWIVQRAKQIAALNRRHQLSETRRETT